MTPYQFVFELHDMFTSPLARISSAYGRTVGGMQRQMRQVRELFTPLGNSMRRSFMAPQGTINDLIKKLDLLRERARNIDVGINRRGLSETNREIQALERRIEKLNKAGVGGGGRFFRGLASGAAALSGGVLGAMAMSSNPYLMAAGATAQLGQQALGATVAPAMQRATTRFQLNELSQNPAFVGQLEKQIVGYAPERTGEMFSASQKLIGAGVDQSKLFDSLKTLSNISALSNVQVDELAMIQAKIRATGYVQGDEKQMLVERGIQIDKYLAKAMGIKQEQVASYQQKGLISYEMFDKALQMFAGKGSIYEKVYERKRDSTPQGRYDYLMGNFNEKLTQLGISVLPQVNKALDYASQLFGQLAPLGEPIMKLVGAFSPLFDATGQLLGAFGILSKEGNLTTKSVENLSNAISGLSTLVRVISEFISGIVNAAVNDPVLKALGVMVPGKGLMDKLRGDVEQPIDDFYANRSARVAQRIDGMADIFGVPKAKGMMLGNTPTTQQGGANGKTGTGGLGAAAGVQASVSGAKSSVVNINFRSFVEKMDVNVATLNEGIDNMEGKFMEMFTRLLASGSAVPS